MGIRRATTGLYVDGMIDEDGIRYRWETVGRKLDERGRRMFAAAEASTAGWGGLAAVSRITGLARSTINRGQDDLQAATIARRGSRSASRCMISRTRNSARWCLTASTM